MTSNVFYFTQCICMCVNNYIEVDRQTKILPMLAHSRVMKGNERESVVNLPCILGISVIRMQHSYSDSNILKIMSNRSAAECGCEAMYRLVSVRA